MAAAAAATSGHGPAAVNPGTKRASMMNGEVFKEWESQHAADVKQKAVREVLAGGSVTEPNRSGSPKGTDKPSVLLKHAQEQGLVPKS